jgi:hypothetical protein
VITQVVNPGLVQVLRAAIIPRLLAEAPPPSEQALQADPHAVRFTLVVDREGYSPALFAELLQQRIAVLTYRKQPGELWPAEGFVRQSVRLHTDQFVEMALAEMGVCLSNGLWVREVRELNDDGSQCSIVTTHRKMDLTQVAAANGARWSQENHLKYMREHFGLDRLIEYGTAPLPATTMVINPAHRRLDQPAGHAAHPAKARLYPRAHLARPVGGKEGCAGPFFCHGAAGRGAACHGKLTRAIRRIGCGWLAPIWMPSKQRRTSGSGSPPAGASCRSKLAEALEKTMKAELIRLGWPLERTHDLEQLLDELVGRSSDLIPRVEPLCDALAEAYFTDRYPGFDLDDPDWDNFQIRLKEVVLLWKQVEDSVTGAGGAASGTASES